MKQINFSDDARNQLAQGVQKLTDCVAVTMGPKGRNVLIQKDYGAPVLTKDGVSVALEVFLENTLEDMGAQLVKEVSANTANEAGDGTTTATVLVNAILQQGLKNITAGANPIEVKKGMELALEEILQTLKVITKDITQDIETEQVATISANSDNKIGTMIAEAMTKVGSDGVITVEAGDGTTDELEVVEGLKFYSGYLSPYFVNNTEKMLVELNNPYILIYHHRITELKSILPVLENVQKLKRPLLIICEDIEGDPLNTLVVNKMKKILDVSVVKAPGYGDIRTNMLEDIAVLTGGTVISDNTGKKLTDITIEDLGQCARINIDKESTLIIDGKDTEEKVQQRVQELKELLKVVSDFEKQQVQDRLAKLSGGVAVIKVGAITETEMKEKKDRVDDALAATKSAVEEGIIIGGGAALVKILDMLKTPEFQNEDQKIGYNIVKKSIEAPCAQITENAGFNAGVVINEIRSTQAKIGFNAVTGEYVDMFDTGIIDSYKVQRVALSNAVSIASMLLTTEAVISKKKED